MAESPSLEAKLMQPSHRTAVVADCADLVDREVESKRGLGGAAIKTSYKVVTAIKPGMVSDVVNRLLPDFCRALEPFHERALAADGPTKQALLDGLKQNTAETAEALLSVTDHKIDSARPAIQKAYKRLRGGAKDHVERAVPGLAEVIGRHLD